MMGLTPRQAECLRAIEDLTVDGVSPTYAQLAARLGITGKGGVCRMVGALVERGLVQRHPHRPRALRVVCPAVPSKTKVEIADEVCRLVWLASQAGEKVNREQLHAFVMEALR